MLDLDDIADVVAAAVKEATAPLVARIAELERREVPPPQKGLDGKDCDMAAVERMIGQQVASAVAAIPPAKDGQDAVLDMDVVAQLIDKAVGALPVPKDGRDCDMAEVERFVVDRVRAAVDALPAPKDGVGLASAFKDHEGALVVTMTDGSTRSLGKIDGEPGRDGLGFDDLNVEQIGERTVRFLLTRGPDTAEFDLTLPVPIYRGVFKESAAYEAGDMATWAGSLWHCNEPKGLKPGEADSGWQLAAKAGRPGKDAGK